jgi:hypothetical protein
MSGVLYFCMGLLFIPFALIGGLASMATQQINGAIGGAVIIVFADHRTFPLWGNRVRVRCDWRLDLQPDREATRGIEIQVEPAPAISL